jgi:predicted adenylyl cyclase CyaB
MNQMLARRNLELKSRYRDLARAREVVARLGARTGGTELQRDTFFAIGSGRLKLREIEGQPAVLIWYDRPDRAGFRQCNYHLVPIPDPAAMKALLTAALGVRTEVCKRREIYFWHNVRIHLDDVAGLGTFIEFEAVLSPADDEYISQSRLDELCRVLTIDPAESLAGAYADMGG